MCVSSEFDTLAREVGLKGSQDGITDDTERARLRAELDGLVAHLYGLSEDEFALHIDDFPSRSQLCKEAVISAYKLFAPKSADQQVRSSHCGRGECDARIQIVCAMGFEREKSSKVMEQVIVKTAAGFLNVESGGTLLIGVEDDGKHFGFGK